MWLDRREAIAKAKASHRNFSIALTQMGINLANSGVLGYRQGRKQAEYIVWRTIALELLCHL
ncbi:hypothetical protein [Aerosakkonema sp. BLCC-F183]|uniref:hypothetical protein n=1 Tax=Aerosakkonema sp. BLCC-F183 TaxID=3342834 RepID=UPI0035BC846F